jgi:hypothetical protein
MEKFITNDVWDEVNDLISNSNKKKMISIAYVTSNNLKLTEGDVLICDASDYSVRNGETSVRALQAYLSQGVEIYSLEQLHSKFLVSEDFLVIGSANLSENSAENLIESAVVTGSEILIQEAICFFNELKTKSANISIEQIKELSEIPIEKAEEQQRVFYKREKILTSSISNVIDSTEEICTNSNQEITDERSDCSTCREFSVVNKAELRCNFDGKETVRVILRPKDIFDYNTIKKYINDTEIINIWKKYIENDDYPTIYGTTKLVEDLPRYILSKSKDNEEYTTMDVFVLCDDKGATIEEPKAVALAKLNTCYYRILE